MYFTIYYTTSYPLCTLLFSMVKYIRHVFLNKRETVKRYFGILVFIHSKIHVWRTKYAFKTGGVHQIANTVNKEL